MNPVDDVVGVPIKDPIYHFPWAQLEAIIAGRSAIDLAGLRIGTREEARDFLIAYGLDPEDPRDAQELSEVHALSAAFIRKVLLPFRDLDDLPEALPASFPELLLLASTSDHPLREWACAFLRVSHAVVHGRYAQNPVVLAAARKQIFERFSSHLQTSAQGMLVSDGEMHIPLKRCDFKPSKPWESLVLKLLHKVDSVAQEVYDHLGVRFVTPDKTYALLLLKYFRAHHVFAFANIKPSRSVNTLVDLEAFKLGFEDLESAYHHGEMSFKQFSRAVHRLGLAPASAPGRNPHSASGYQAIQFTARALVRLDRIRTFVPFEVQIMDEEAYESALEGEANHETYRARQRLAVCRRVFPWAEGSQALEHRIAQGPAA